MGEEPNLSVRTKGLVVLCSPEGTVKSIIHDDIGITDAGQIKCGSFLRIFEKADSDKAANFFSAIRDKGAVFNWQLNVSIDENISTLNFTGCLADSDILIAGAHSLNGVMLLYEELIKINNEQVNILRSTMKDMSLKMREQIERDSFLYDELSRLNNELVTLQRELTKKNIELQRLNNEKNRFLGIAAHDLRHPLAVIQSYSEFLIDEASHVLNDEQKTFLTVISSSSEFMMQLVNDLLDVAVIESGKLNLELKKINIISLAEKNIALSRVFAEKKNIRLIFQPESESIYVSADPSKIEQVLNNFIGNAIKFSHPGKSVYVSIKSNRDEILAAVRDEGQGIPAHELDNLFKPFTKTSIRGTGGEKSTGLGLAICRRIIEGHKGRIWAESKEGEGSTFYFSLPADQL